MSVAPAQARRCLTETRDVIGEIENLLVAHRRQYLGHDAIVAVPCIALILAQRFCEIILTLVGDVRNVFAAGQIQIVTAVAQQTNIVGMPPSAWRLRNASQIPLIRLALSKWRRLFWSSPLGDIS